MKTHGNYKLHNLVISLFLVAVTIVIIFVNIYPEDDFELSGIGLLDRTDGISAINLNISSEQFNRTVSSCCGVFD